MDKTLRTSQFPKAKPPSPEIMSAMKAALETWLDAAIEKKPKIWLNGEDAWRIKVHDACGALAHAMEICHPTSMPELACAATWLARKSMEQDAVWIAANEGRILAQEASHGENRSIGTTSNTLRKRFIAAELAAQWPEHREIIIETLCALEEEMLSRMERRPSKLDLAVESPNAWTEHARAALREFESDRQGFISLVGEADAPKRHAQELMDVIEKAKANLHLPSCARDFVAESATIAWKASLQGLLLETSEGAQAFQQAIAALRRSHHFQGWSVSEAVGCAGIETLKAMVSIFAGKAEELYALGMATDAACFLAEHHLTSEGHKITEIQRAVAALPLLLGFGLECCPVLISCEGEQQSEIERLRSRAGRILEKQSNLPWEIQDAARLAKLAIDAPWAGDGPEPARKALLALAMGLMERPNGIESAQELLILSGESKTQDLFPLLNAEHGLSPKHHPIGELRRAMTDLQKGLADLAGPNTKIPGLSNISNEISKALSLSQAKLLSAAEREELYRGFGPKNSTKRQERQIRI